MSFVVVVVVVGDVVVFALVGVFALVVGVVVVVVVVVGVGFALVVVGVVVTRVTIRQMCSMGFHVDQSKHS